MRAKIQITALLDYESRRLFVILLVVLIWGCAGTPSGHVKPGIDLSHKSGVRALEQQLRLEVRQWQGTPHKWGGTTKRGVDCSGFVQRLYRDIFRHSIPRSTRLQAKYGKYIKKSRLMPGDVVFFKLTVMGRHVGIYLGQNDFAHASSSKGVTVSSLLNSYWNSHYWISRRYLQY